jgi:hypothetical protein
MDRLQVFYYNLYAVLIPTCPVNTGNMQRHIQMDVQPDYIYVKIEAPNEKTGYDYALAVNEGLAATAQNREMSEKESRNYHWVQRALEQAAELTAERVSWEGGISFEIH